MSWEGLAPPYSTIVADPPWKYNATRNMPAPKSSTAEAHYSTLSMREISELPVGDLAAENAALLMWVTNPRLFGDRNDEEVTPLDIVRAWGFEYRTLLTWVKTAQTGDVDGGGMGWYFRGATEHVMFCTRGTVSIPTDKRRANVIRARRGAHSTKPDAFFDLVTSVLPGPYVELFARAPRLGWDHWGYGFEGAS